MEETDGRKDIPGVKRALARAVTRVGPRGPGLLNETGLAGDGNASAIGPVHLGGRSANPSVPGLLIDKTAEHFWLPSESYRSGVSEHRGGAGLLTRWRPAAGNCNCDCSGAAGSRMLHRGPTSNSGWPSIATSKHNREAQACQFAKCPAAIPGSAEVPVLAEWPCNCQMASTEATLTHSLGALAATRSKLNRS